MERLDVYDPAMCCSTGVCGPEVDPKLVRFAADVKWLLEQGVAVRRFNLSQNPVAFVENDQVKQALTDKGEAALPMVIASGRVVSSGRYPDRGELAAWAGLPPSARSICSAAEPDACCGAQPAPDAPASGKCGGGSEPAKAAP